MDPGPLRDALTLLAGLGTGFMSAAFGVGGAVISTPAIRALGISAAVAVGTTLPSILPSAATGTLRYRREGLIDFRVVAWTAPAGIVAAVGGSLLSKVVPGDGHWLMVATALLLAFTAYRMARQPDVVDVHVAETDEVAAAHPRVQTRNDTPTVLVGIGALAGLMSGLLGVGGGIVMVPGFTEVARLPLKMAIASSLACVGLFAIPGTITHAALGDIDWRVAVLLAIGVVPGARLGAHAAIRTSQGRLRVAVAAFLGTVSLLYLAGELISLAR